MEAHAWRATLASSRALRDLGAAATARLTLSRVFAAFRSHIAYATRAGLVQMEAHARRAAQESIKVRLEQTTAAAARQTRAHPRRAQL